MKLSQKKLSVQCKRRGSHKDLFSSVRSAKLVLVQIDNQIGSFVSNQLVLIFGTDKICLQCAWVGGSIVSDI